MASLAKDGTFNRKTVMMLLCYYCTAEVAVSSTDKTNFSTHCSYPQDGWPGRGTEWTGRIRNATTVKGHAY